MGLGSAEDLTNRPKQVLNLKGLVQGGARS
jgi:hypothetical protein